MSKCLISLATYFQKTSYADPPKLIRNLLNLMIYSLIRYNHSML